MSHACHRFWKCYKTLTFCSHLRRCRIPCACYAKRHLNVQKWSEHVVFLTFWPRNVLRATSVCTFSTSQFPKAVWTSCVLYTFWLRHVLRATTACTFSTSQLPKVVRMWSVFSFFTCTCASHHNSMHFFDIATSKSAPKLRCFLLFTCKCVRTTTACTFSTSQLLKRAPKLRCFLLFTCKCVRTTTACTFSTSQLLKRAPKLRCFVHWVGNVLRATTACNFSSLIWPAGSASTALASLLFDPSEPQIKSSEKRSVSRLSYLFTHLDLLSSKTFSFWSSFYFSLLFSDSSHLCFSSIILSEVWLLNFLRRSSAGKCFVQVL